MEDAQTRMLGLAYRIAMDFGTTDVTEQSARALSRLLPGVKYCSLVVEHPCMPSLIGVGNYCRQGLGDINVHDRETSIAGLVLHKRRPLQGSLSGSSGKVLSCLSDVQSMLNDAQSCDFIICLPIQPTAGAVSQETVKGAMLMGFESPPDLGRRCLAATSLLCALLASTLYRPVEEIVSLVAHLCGTPSDCTCDLADSENDDDEEDDEFPSGSPCKEDKPHPPDAPESDHTLKIPGQRVHPFNRISTDSAVGSERYSTDSALWEWSAKSPVHDQPAGKETFKQENEDFPDTCKSEFYEKMPGRPGKRVSTDKRVTFDAIPEISASRRSFDYRRRSFGESNPSSRTSFDNLPSSSSPKGDLGIERMSSYDSAGSQSVHVDNANDWVNTWGSAEGSILSNKNAFSKALVTGLEIEDLNNQHPFWLIYEKPLLEEEFGRWFAHRQLAVDIMFNLLLLLSLTLMRLHCPSSMRTQGATGMLLSASLTLPLLCIALAREFYLKHRDIFVIGMRLYMIWFMNLASLPVLLAHLPATPWWQCLCFWVLSGSEGLFSASMGLQVRMHLHLPLQFVMLGAAAYHLPEICMTCYSHMSQGVCVAAAMTVGAGLGCFLPSIMLRKMEVRARRVFARHIGAAAGF